MGVNVKRWGAVSAAALAALFAGAAILVPGVRADGAVIGLDPPSQNVATDAASATVNVKLTGASHVAAWEFILAYDTAKIDVSDVTEGPFLKSSGHSTECLRSADITGFVLSAAKTAVGTDTATAIQYACSISPGSYVYGADVGAAGDGVLATITLKPKQTGTANLLFLRRQLSDSSEVTLSSDSADGVVQVVAPGGGGTLQPTPTANAANLTPVGQPTREVDPFVRGSSSDSTPAAGSSATQPTAVAAQTGTTSSDGMLGPAVPGGGVLSAVGTPASSGAATSGDSIGAAGSDAGEGFPHAGYGPQPSEPNPVWRVLELAFAAIGGVFVLTGIARRRQGRVRAS